MKFVCPADVASHDQLHFLILANKKTFRCMIRCLITEWPYCPLAIPGSDHDVSTFPCNVFKNSRLLNFSKLLIFETFITITYTKY